MSDTKPPNRIAVRLLIGLGTVLAALAILAVWAERQALDTEEWVKTSSKLLEDEEIQVALSDFVVGELFRAVDVEAQLQRRLPAEARPLAGPAAGGLRQLATGASRRALESPRVQTAWANANRAAHRLLLDLIEGGGETVSAEGGAVTLHLRPLVSQLAERVGVGGGAAEKLPADIADLEIMQADQIEVAQRVAEVIRGLAVALSLGTLVAFGLAIYLSRGRRQMTVLWCGVGLIVAGVAVFALRKVAGDAIVEALVTDEGVMDAANHTWSIGTSLMTSIATTVIVFGFLFVIASWLASPTGSARAARHALAPTFRDRPVLVYGLLATAALIYLALAPDQGLRVLFTLALLTGLAAVGLEGLRRQAAEEFPDVRPGEAAARLRSWAGGLGGRGAAPAPDAAEAAEERRLERLERLARLREQGVLSEAEFATEKARALGNGASPEPRPSTTRE
jgi:hypothetical protein